VGSLQKEDPEKYSNGKDGWMAATELVCVEWAKQNRDYLAEKKLKQRVKKLKAGKDIGEQYKLVVDVIGDDEDRDTHALFD